MLLTYAEYLKLDRRLDIQQAHSDPPEHDEMLFIIIHQTYELWFKLLLHEFEKVKRDFALNDLFEAIHTFQRARTVMKTLVGQIDIIETMTPMSFTSFRDRLDTASGFQSVQFREIEFCLGYKRRDMLDHIPESSPGRDQLLKRSHDKSVVDYFYDFLEQRGADIPDELRTRDLSESNVANESVQDALLELYRARNELRILFELMTDFDEGMQAWRYRHVKLVERTIGNKRGTGGSLGVEFLKRSLFRPIFPDLWAIRHRL